ncbi:MAG: hypothetical protein ABEI07_00235 [Candidatus Nanohaloarchaea archaeon]
MVRSGGSRDEEEIGELVRQLSDREGVGILELQRDAVELVPGREREGATLEEGNGFYNLEVEGREVEYRASVQGMETGILGVLVERNGEEQVYYSREQDINLENPAYTVYEEDDRERLVVTYSA